MKISALWDGIKGYKVEGKCKYMKVSIKIASAAITAVMPLMGITAGVSALATPEVVAPQTVASAAAANICGPSYHQTVKDPILYTQDDQVSNGNLLVNWSQSLHTWCLVGTSTGPMATRQHAYWGSICLAPAKGLTGQCSSTSSKVYKQSQGLDKSYFIVKMADPSHGFTVFNVQTSSTRNINKGNIYAVYHNVQVPPSQLPQ